MKYNYLGFRGFLMLILMAIASFNTFSQTRPNIIFVLADDLGYNDVGFNGSTDIPTPELDVLADQGTVFSSAYVLHPFCGPSRAGLLTGRYPHEIGSQFNLPSTGTGSDLGVPTDQKFMSKMLQEAGYQTGLVGKWHLGKEPEYHPNVRGFDDFYGFLGGGHEYFPDYYKQQYANGSNWDYNAPMEHNGVEVTDDDEYITDELSNEAIRFIEESAAGTDPFFLFISYNAPHTPLRAKTEDLAVPQIAAIADGTRQTYAAMVYAMDRGVGRVVDALQAQGVYDNTLIVFLSDNGGRTDQGGNNFPLSGSKGNTLEGGFRVPMFWHWPSNVPSDQTYDHVISALDFYPTFAYLANADVSANGHLDGKNVWNEITTGADARVGDPIFSLRHNASANEVGVRRDEWKAYKWNNAAWKLFNIENDISEQTDLSSQFPELLDTLIARASKWSEDHVEPLFWDSPTAASNWVNNNMPNYAVTFGSVIDLGFDPDESAPYTDPTNADGWIYNEEVSDEFDGTTLDEEKWLIQGRNGEYQSNWIGRAPSQFSTENVRVEDGKLKLETRWEPDYPFSETPQADGTEYENITTAAVITRKQFLYGYMEIRCKAADAEITSSFWTTGFESELDMFEMFGDHRQPSKESQGFDNQYKWQYIDWSPGLETRRVYGEDYILDWRVADDFHVYGCEWDPEYLKFYADGELLGSITKDQMEALGNEWVLTNPFWIWVDQETFPWNGLPTEEEAGEFPVDFEIDYIRVWQKEYKNILDRGLFGFEGPLRKDGNWLYWLIPAGSVDHLEIVNEKAGEGNNSLKFHYTGSLPSNVAATSPTGSVEMESGEYTLATKVWLETGNAPDKMDISFGDSGENNITLDMEGLPNGQWVTLKTNFTRNNASTATDNLTITINSTDTNGTDVILYIEDVSIEPYPGIYEGSVWNGLSWDVAPPSENARLIFQGNYNNSGNLNASHIEIEEGKSVTIPSGSTLTLTGEAQIGDVIGDGSMIFEDFEGPTIPSALNISGEVVTLESDIQSRDSQVLRVSYGTDSRVFYQLDVAEAGNYRLSFLMTATNSYHFTRLENANGAVVGSLISSSGSGLNSWTEMTQDYSLNPGSYYLRFQSSSNTSHSVYVDDIKLENLDSSTGTVQYNTRLTIASGASLIVPDGFDQPVTFVRNTSFGDNDRKYSMVGIPVQSYAEITGSVLGSDVFQYNETIPFDMDAGLSRWEDASSLELIPGRGYTQTSKQDLTFTGIPNSGTITISNLTKTATGTASTDNQGWHLLSNPYGAAMDVSKFLAVNSSNIESSIRIWDDGQGTSGGRGNGGNYLTVNQVAAVGGSSKTFEGYIGSMQGFFVKAINDNVSVDFTQNMLVTGHNTDATFFRKFDKSDNAVGIKLSLSDGKFKDELYVGIVEGATVGYDPQFDATKLYSNEGLQFFSLIEESKLAIQSIPVSYAEAVLLGFNTDKSTNLEIKVEDLIIRDETMSFYLTDKLTGITHDLSVTSTFSFSSASGFQEDRFSLAYRSKEIIAIAEEPEPGFWVEDGQIRIDFLAPENVLGYAVYDLSGRVIVQSNRTQFDTHNLNIGINRSGFYVLKLVTSDRIYARKFIL
ncbi:MAG: sulfatase-like hydrolase/transferase [Cyclobacteriaceae bacterium]